MELSLNHRAAATIMLATAIVIGAAFTARAYATVAIPKAVTSAAYTVQEERKNLQTYHAKAEQARAEHVAPWQNKYKQSVERMNGALHVIHQNGYRYDILNDKLTPLNDLKEPLTFNPKAPSFQ